MNILTSTSKDAFIIVIPYDCFNRQALATRLKIEKLCFWHNDGYEHPVCDAIMPYFLSHATLYKASIYPDKPELGCYATDSELRFDIGETTVYEIYYQGELIYRHHQK